MNEAIELLRYCSERLLFSSEKRKIMDARVKAFLEEHDAANSSGKHR